LRRLVLLGVVALFLGSVFVGCQKSPAPTAPSDGALSVPVAAVFEGIPCGEPMSVTLYAGQHFDAGDVMVSVEEGILCVEILTSGNWVMTETHVAIATELDSIPQTGSGNPKVGKFLFSTDHDPPVTYFSYCTDPLLYLYDPGEVYIAVHASLILLDESGEPVQEETGWGDGPEFPGNSWATYFTYAVEDCGGGQECTITVTYPNGGEEICIDFPCVITWEPGEYCGQFVTIELLQDGVECMTIADSALNTGEYEWIASQCGGIPEGYKVRVTETGSMATDESDAPFSIIFCGGGE